MTATRPIPVIRPAGHPGDLLTARRRLIYVLVLGALTALGPFTVDLYLPAFPDLERDFAVGPAAIQLTLTGTMVGFGLGQLVVGPLSDKVGRRLPLIVSALVHIAACIGAALAPDIAWLLAFRVLQGFGAAAGGVVAMAMVRDLFGGKPLVRMLSRLALVSGLAPVVAPLIGSQLLLVTDWRGVFWCLAAYGLVVAACVTFLIVETLPPGRRHVAGHATARDRYRALLTDRVFIGATLTGGVVFTGLFSYLSSSSFLFQQVYAFSPQQYGVLFAVNSVGIIVGVQTASWLMRHSVGPQWILSVSTAALLVFAVAIIVLDRSGAGFWGTAVPLWFFIAACGFSFPSVQVLALANHGAEAGTAASFGGAVNFVLAGAVTPIIGALGVGSAVPMAVVMAACAVAAIAGVWLLIRPRTVPPLQD